MKKIFLCASHTHGSLQTDPQYKFGDFNNNYNELIINKVIEAVKVAKSKKLSDYKIKYGEAPVSPIAVNRRLYTLTLGLNEPFKKVQNKPNANKKYPDKIKTLSFHNEFDDPKLILVNFACHPLLDNVGETLI